jgi:hypothetical protein
VSVRIYGASRQSLTLTRISRHLRSCEGRAAFDVCCRSVNFSGQAVETGSDVIQRGQKAKWRAYRVRIQKNPRKTAQWIGKHFVVLCVAWVRENWEMKGSLRLWDVPTNPPTKFDGWEDSQIRLHLYRIQCVAAYSHANLRVI